MKRLKLLQTRGADRVAVDGEEGTQVEVVMHLDGGTPVPAEEGPMHGAAAEDGQAQRNKVLLGGRCRGFVYS